MRKNGSADVLNCYMSSFVEGTVFPACAILATGREGRGGWAGGAVEDNRSTVVDQLRATDLKRWQRLGFGEEGRGEVTFAEAAHDGDDAFAAELGTSGDLSGGPHVGAAADAGHDPFVLG